ncbi:RuBisCO LSMT substrate-binding protein [Rhizoctonia solani 123E]|uniref:RuBisCO LSMT substrate-binding protein n=1 Tax=Rhizoctonia solani 123E TaxID=1423351 RepID=A0A074SZ88_9AGAM|nr:RuBisCO LSMT substrate-binding protein [Rhizoctonia solani 123E]
MDLAWPRLQKLVRSEEAAIIKVEARYVDGAGRGLFATQDLSALETLVSVPGRLLLNARTLSNLYPGPILPQSISALEVNSLRLSSIQLLSLHLYRIKRGVKDVIFDAYIDTLPSSFSDHPITIIQNPEIRSLLLKLVPVSVGSMLLDVEQRLKDDWKLAMDILGKFPNLFPPGSKEEVGDPSFISEDYMWAWLNVNTRCLYHDLGFVQSSENVTMCPILDFANHTSMYSLSITQGEFALGDEMAFSTSTPVKEGDQIYLRYGPHSNAFLFCEYGFVLPLDVKDARIADGEIVIDSDVEELLRNANDFKLKEELLKDRNYWGDWTFHVEDGVGRPSYRVIPALRLFHMSLNYEDDANPGLKLWEDSILGLTENISAENESKVRESIIELCEVIIQRSTTKISQVRSQAAETEVIRPAEWLQILSMVERLWEEEHYVAESVRQATLNGIVF